MVKKSLIPCHQFKISDLIALNVVANLSLSLSRLDLSELTFTGPRRLIHLLQIDP